MDTGDLGIPMHDLSRKKLEDWGGPYLQAATFCDQVIEGKDGVLSVVRAIDRVFRVAYASHSELVQSLPPVRVNATLLIMLKSGDARGSHTVWLQGEAPSGLSFGPRIENTVYFEGDERGVNFIIPVEFDAEGDGLYWFAVGVGSMLVTRVPLRVVSQAQVGLPPP